MERNQQHTITHKLDPKQFTALMHVLAARISDDPEKLEALTAKLRASGIALEAVTKQTKFQPQKGTIPMSQEFDALSAQVKANTDVEAAAILLINGIAAKLAALVAGGTIDPAAVTALSASLKASADSLAADLVANTPAA